MDLHILGIMLADCLLLMLSIGLILIFGIAIGVEAIRDGGGFLFVLYLCF